MLQYLLSFWYECFISVITSELFVPFAWIFILTFLFIFVFYIIKGLKRN